MQSLVFAAALSIVPAFCAGAGPAHDTLSVGLTAFTADFHPGINLTGGKRVIEEAARRNVTSFDRDWRLVCLLCVTLPSLENGTAWVETRADGARGIAARYVLRPGLAWADGTPVTSDDVRFSWMVGRHPMSGYAEQDIYVRQIADIEVEDPRSFVVHRTGESCDYANLTNLALLPAHLERAKFEANPNDYRLRNGYDSDPTQPGLWNGPYRIASLERGSTVVLEPNPHWPGKKPAFRRVVFRSMENTATIEPNLASGQIDMIAGESGLPHDLVRGLLQRYGDRLQVEERPTLSFQHLELKLDNPILADLRVRRAMLHALDRETMVRQIYGTGFRLEVSPINPADPAFIATGIEYPFDRARASALLDEAGWKTGADGIRVNQAGQRLSLEFVTSAGFRLRELEQQAVQAQLRSVGIETRIANQQQRVLFGQSLRERSFQGIVQFTWSTQPGRVPRETYGSGFIPSRDNNFAGQNYGGWRDAEADAALASLETTCAAGPRRDAWRRFLVRYAEQLPSLPLWFRTDPFPSPKWLRGYRPTGHLHSGFEAIEEWTVAP